MSVFGLSREHVGGDVCLRCPRELFVCWGVSTWPPLHRTSGIAVGTVRRSCSGRGSLCLCAGPWGRGRGVQSWTPCLTCFTTWTSLQGRCVDGLLGYSQDAGAITLSWSLSSWVAQGAMRVRRKPVLPQSTVFTLTSWCSLTLT